TAAASGAKTEAAHQTVAEAGLDLIDDAVTAGNFKVSQDLMKVVTAAAVKAKSLVLSGRVKTRGEELDALLKEYDALKPALTKLKDSPDDAAANLQVGKFLCLRQGDWEKGLPLLAKGSDAKLKAQAANDLAKPTKAAKQVEVGDGWWNLAE